MILWCKPNTDPLIEQENDVMMILWCKSNIDPFIEQENDDFDTSVYDNEDLTGTDDQANCKAEFENLINTHLPCFSDSVTNKSIRSPNEKQREVFDIVNKWYRDFVKNLSAKLPCKTETFSGLNLIFFKPGQIVR